MGIFFIFVSGKCTGCLGVIPPRLLLKVVKGFEYTFFSFERAPFALFRAYSVESLFFSWLNVFRHADFFSFSFYKRKFSRRKVGQGDLMIPKRDFSLTQKKFFIQTSLTKGKSSEPAKHSSARTTFD